MLSPKTRFNYLFKLIWIAILIGMSLRYSRAEDQKDYGDYPKEIRQYLQCLLSKGQHQYAFRSDYPGGFDAWQKQARPILHKLVGLDKIAEQVGRHKPEAQMQHIEDLGQYTRQKGWIETEPHVRISFWLLKPKKRGPFPLAIFPHGHDSRGYDTSAGVYHDPAHRDKILREDRDVAVQAVNAALSPSPQLHGVWPTAGCRTRGDATAIGDAAPS